MQWSIYDPSKRTSANIVTTSLNFNCCLLTIGLNTVAIIKISEERFKIFDSHSRDLYGMLHSFGKCVLLTVEGFQNLTSYFQICSTIQGGSVQNVDPPFCTPLLDPIWTPFWTPSGPLLYPNSGPPSGSPSGPQSGPPSGPPLFLPGNGQMAVLK